MEHEPDGVGGEDDVGIGIDVDARRLVDGAQLHVQLLRDRADERAALPGVESALRLRDNGDLGVVRAVVPERDLRPLPHTPHGIDELRIAKRSAREVHVPESRTVRDGHAKLAVEKRKRLLHRVHGAAAIGAFLPLFEMRHVVALVDEELAVQRCAREVLALHAVLAQPAALHDPMLRRP